MGVAGVRFQRESAVDVLKQIEPLLKMHWEEIAHFKDIALEPDLDRYLTARNESKELVGYAIFFILRNPHYRSSLQATQDVLFIRPDSRGFGAKFILWCDHQLKQEKVQVVYHHVKKAHNFGPMLERMGYELVDYIYARRMD
jgi:hypothetical protein